MADTDEKKKRFTEFLKGWFQEGMTKPQWCFVVDDGVSFKGRIIYWTFPNQPNSYKIASLKLPHHDEEEFFSIGEKLITESCKTVSDGKNVEFEYHLYSKGNDYFDNYKKLLQHCGFVSTQEKNSFLLEVSIEEQSSSDITFRNLTEVGEEDFIKAIELVSVNTLDTDDQLSIEKLGSEGAALDYYNTLKSIDLQADWWQLAYDNQGNLIGLVVPQKLDETCGAINYIGVVPGKRGNGYVKELLIKGTSILNEHGLDKVVADIDDKNYPLKKTLEKLGYKLDSKMINYKKLN